MSFDNDTEKIIMYLLPNIYFDFRLDYNLVVSNENIVKVPYWKLVPYKPIKHLFLCPDPGRIATV